MPVTDQHPAGWRLSFVRLADEVRLRPHWTVPQIVFYRSTEMCDPPLQGPDLDLLNTLVTFAALYGVRFIEYYWWWVEVVPMKSDAVVSAITLQ